MAAYTSNVFLKRETGQSLNVPTEVERFISIELTPRAAMVSGPGAGALKRRSVKYKLILPLEDITQ
jgi:hypothetical protein